MGYDTAWLEEIGLDTKTGIDYTGSPEKYVSAVCRFYKNFEKNKSKIEEYHASIDYESYMITVHALKSNAKMIGALDLSKSFEDLETAARNNDIKTIDEKTSVTLLDYERLMEKLKPIEALGEVRVADEISGEEAKKVADSLLEALDDFDDELSKTLVQKLSGYPFRITQKEKLKEAETFVNDFMYDEAAEIIKEIYSAIE